MKTFGARMGIAFAAAGLLFVASAPAQAATVGELINDLIGPYQTSANKPTLLPFKAQAENFARAKGILNKTAVRETARFDYGALRLQMKFQDTAEPGRAPGHRDLLCVKSGCTMN